MKNSFLDIAAELQISVARWMDSPVARILVSGCPETSTQLLLPYQEARCAKDGACGAVGSISQDYEG